MIRFTILMLWLYLICQFLIQFVLSYSYVDLSNKQRILENKMQELKIENGYLEDQIASSSSLLNAEQKANEWGFQIPRKDQVIKL